ncbi:MAG: cobalamin B12-binding domain-containing protein [Roseobacter sp.]|jgi:methanogenic corrinoid protein MtbC1|nr:cobalamin B12-binding domain-containing protein [Roseobacter sp.]
MTLNLHVYETSQSNVLRLKSQLPPDAVEVLAREVLERLAKRGVAAQLQDLSDTQIDNLCEALVVDDPLAGAEYISGLRQDGLSVEVVYLHHLTEAARRLGEWWDTDKLTFTQVSVGASRIFSIMRALEPRLPAKPRRTRRSAMFASVPGETHTLGVRMAADLLRSENWEISLKQGMDHDALVAEVEAEQPAIIGLSAAGRHAVPELLRLVIALRLSTPSSKILVGGAIVETSADTLGLMGLDGLAADYEMAKTMLYKLWNDAAANTQPR